MRKLAQVIHQGFESIWGRLAKAKNIKGLKNF
jgi:hypothetical protein